MAVLTFSNRYLLDARGGDDFEVDSGDRLTGTSTAQVREKAGGGNDDDSFDVGEAIQISFDGGSTWKNFTYFGSFEGGIVYGRNDKFFLLTNNSYERNEPVSVSYTPSPVCFVAGTLIATPEGPRAIESLRPGQLVLTPAGPQAVKFVARTSCRLNALRALGKMPVCITAGAFGDLGPECDTCLSPAHAIQLEGHLVEAGALINGTSVVQLDSWSEGDSITYYNIELEAHSLIWANGMLAETYFANYRTNGFSRESWDNYAEYLELYGSSELMDELPMPRIPFARQLPVSLRVRLQLNEPATPGLRQGQVAASA
jgi:hypothetical protein